MVLFSYVYSAGDSVDFFENVLHGRDSTRGYGAENRFGYRNPAVDALVERGGARREMGERLARYQDAMLLVLDDLPLVPLLESSWVYGIADGVEWAPPLHGWVEAAQVRRRAASPAGGPSGGS